MGPRSRDSREAKGRVRLEQVAIVLFRPQIPENIGAVARAACNMGITRLHVVQPVCLDPERLRMMATPAAAHLVENLKVHQDLLEALGPFNYVVGTTARLGGIRREVLSPREIAPRLIELSRHNDIALLFGPENFGLTNRELPYCHALVTIPTADCASLNLAQAVMVLAYELMAARSDPPPLYAQAGQHPGAGIHVRHASGDPGENQLYQPSEPGILDAQCAPAVQPPRSQGQRDPGHQRHLPAD